MGIGLSGMLELHRQPGLTLISTRFPHYMNVVPYWQSLLDTVRLSLKVEALLVKRAPIERWREHILWGYEAFRASIDLSKLRQMGLRVLGRRRMLTDSEWWEAAKGPMTSQEYRAFQDECRTAGAQYGLAPWTVEMASLLRVYRPGKERFVVEARWPQAWVVTEATDPLFCSWLRYEARRLGLYVAHQYGSNDVRLIQVPFPERPAHPLTQDHRPPRAEAFYLRIETPPEYPSEAAAELARQLHQRGRALLRRLGYRVPQRMRRSIATPRVRKLRLGKARLDRHEVGDIAQDIYPEIAAVDPSLRRRVKSQRYRARKRVVEFK